MPYPDYNYGYNDPYSSYGGYGYSQQNMYGGGGYMAPWSIYQNQSYSPMNYGNYPMQWGTNPWMYQGGGMGDWGGGSNWGSSGTDWFSKWQNQWQSQIDDLKQQLAARNNATPSNNTPDTTQSQPGTNQTTDGNTSAPNQPQMHTQNNQVNTLTGKNFQYQTYDQAPNGGMNFGKGYLKTGQFSDKGLNQIKQMGYVDASGNADSQAYLAANQGLVDYRDYRQQQLARKNPMQQGGNSTQVQNGKAVGKPDPRTL